MKIRTIIVINKEKMAEHKGMWGNGPAHVEVVMEGKDGHRQEVVIEKSEDTQAIAIHVNGETVYRLGLRGEKS